MTAPKRTPDDTTLERWYLVERLTYKQMRERWSDTPGGDTVSVAAFQAACSSADWFVPRKQKNRHVGTEYWPWLNVRPEHTDLHDAAMLRLYGRRQP